MNRVALFAIACSALSSATALGADSDQSYSRWRYSEAKGYYYCQYLYKSNSGDVAYKEQLVIFNPKDPKWVYWCLPADNPDNKSDKPKLWGRCPTKAHPDFKKLVKAGKDIWSLLPDDKKKTRLVDLDEGDFPKAKEMAKAIPGSRDPKRTIACPPDPPNLPD
jgi:hypothetical protein